VKRRRNAPSVKEPRVRRAQNRRRRPAGTAGRTGQENSLANVRGTLNLNTVDFVCERYGPQAHERVLRSLPSRPAATFLGPVSEASWQPLEDLVAYMERARGILAPGEPGFYRRIGFFAGQRDRQTRAFSFMLADVNTAARMASVLWRSYFDAGRLGLRRRTREGRRSGFTASPRARSASGLPARSKDSKRRSAPASPRSHACSTGAPTASCG
jgi:hypothetical protein